MSEPPETNKAWTPTTQYIVSIVLFIIGILFVYVTRKLFASLLIAALISSLLMPLVRFLRYRIRLSHRSSAILTYGLFIVFVSAVPLLFAPRAIVGINALTSQIAVLITTLSEIGETDLKLLGFTIPPMTILQSAGMESAAALLPDDILGRVSAISSNLMWVLIALVAVFYMLLDWERMRDWLFAQAPPHRRDDMRRLYHEIKTVWQAYMRGQFTLSLVVGAFSGFASAAIGLPGAWAIGLMAGVFDVIPTVGPAIAMIIAAIVGLYSGTTVLPVSNLVFAIIILSMFGVIQSIENIWWRPRILGNSLKIHSGLVFVGVMGSIALSGIFATLVVVPVMGTVGVAWRYIRARMIGISPWPDDDFTASADNATIEELSAETTHPSSTTTTNPPQSTHLP